MVGADTFREQENTQQSLVQSSDSSASVIVLALYCAETQRSIRIRELLSEVKSDRKLQLVELFCLRSCRY